MRRGTSTLLCLALLASGCVVTVRRLGELPECADSGRTCLVQAATPSPSEMVRGGALNPDLLVVGARVFDERCAVCHGDRGHGDGTLADVLPIKPRDYHSDAFLWGTRPSQIVVSVANGRSGIMPPFREALTESEMWAVAYLVWRWIPADRREPDTEETLLNWKLPPPGPEMGLGF